MDSIEKAMLARQRGPSVSAATAAAGSFFTSRRGD